MALSFNEQLNTGTLIVDALNLAFRWKHQGRTDFRYEYEKTVNSLADSYKCKDIIITADGGASSYRKNILPSYKQNRKDKYATQTEEEQIAFEEFFEEYQATLDMLNTYLTVLRFDGVEADDIAAHLVKEKDKYAVECACEAWKRHIDFPSSPGFFTISVSEVTGGSGDTFWARASRLGSSNSQGVWKCVVNLQR